MADEQILDHAVWASLTGAHAALAERVGGAARFPADVSPFGAIEPGRGPEGWADLADLLGPGGRVALFGEDTTAPDSWTVIAQGQGVQMVDEGMEASGDPGVVELGRSDVDDMLALVARAQPGPFLPRTVELGRYIGIREGGALIAMAGERLHPAGWTEISAVCTDAAHRGRGLATRLVRAVAAGIRDRGEVPFLHTAEDNERAIRLYRSLGFSLRRTVTFQLVQAPA